MDKSQNIIIENFHGVLGNVESIGILSTGNNSQNTHNLENKEQSSILINKKDVINILIELNEINGISYSKNEISNKIQKALEYFLEGKTFFIELSTNRYKKELDDFKETSEERNYLLRLNNSNIKKIKKAEFILNNVLNVLNELFLPKEIELILIGIIEYYKKQQYSNMNKVSFGRVGLDFYCYNQILDEDMKELNEKVQKEIGYPYSFIDFNSGYDIHHLPYNAKYTKAIPTILFEMHEQNIDLSKLEKYLYLRIGN